MNTKELTQLPDGHQKQAEPPKEIERLTDEKWRNLYPWECCGQDDYCQRGCCEEGGCTKGCIVPKLYKRLAQYEDTGLDPQDVALVVAALVGRELAQIVEISDVPFSRMIELAKAEKDNGPLTMEELQTMEGQPVWCEDGCGHKAWCLVTADQSAIDSDTGLWDGDFYGMENATGDGLHGMGWLAYRRKPEGGKGNA